jgi:hypothetical protein
MAPRRPERTERVVLVEVLRCARFASGPSGWPQDGRVAIEITEKKRL